MKIYLIKHAEKVNVVGDPALTPRGVEQAIKTAQYLGEKEISAIYASPLLRARQTAEIIAETLKLKCKTEELLKERVNWDNPGQSFEEFLMTWRKASVERDWVPPIGDSSRVSGKRLQKVIESLDGDRANVVLVTHGGIITDFLRNVFSDLLINSKIKGVSVPQDDIIKDCSVTIVSYNHNKNRYDLVDVASTKHL